MNGFHVLLGASVLLAASNVTPSEHTFVKELKGIAAVESKGCSNKNHPVIASGIHTGDRAGGCWGLMPNTVIQIIKSSPALARKYRAVLRMATSQITEKLNRDIRFDAELAFTHWVQLRTQFSVEEAAYAWLRGPASVVRASRDKIAKSSYVQSVLSNIRLVDKTWPSQRPQVPRLTRWLESFLPISPNTAWTPAASII